ncbi:MAG: hypothetical protein IJG70_04910 [Kiritimatiellae bacterium]|nr:hypothetical protein [Kiritimatiellia bacterium]
MLSELLLASAIQIGPFWQHDENGSAALRPLWSTTAETTDVLWPVFTSHRDWWRCCFVAHYMTNDAGWQFSLLPLWWNGTAKRRGVEGAEPEPYWGLFPLWGTHPHFLALYDFDFALWPLYHAYSTPRPGEDRMMRSRSVLFPFFHWRDDGSWGFWPVCGVGHQRESDHRYFLWPIFTWADYRADRDTAGVGYSWMFWPLVGHVEREREDQWLVIPPLFSLAVVSYPEFSTPEEEIRGMLLRCPWPIFEWENSANRERIAVLPLYERIRWRSMKDGEFSGSVTRFGWKLVELYDDETRVFPIWTSRRDGSYFRLWPFWESSVRDGVEYGRFLSLFPIRHVPAVDRNWSKFWTFYEREENPVEVNHSLFWGIIRWRTSKP